MTKRLYKNKIPHVKNSFRSGAYLYTTNFSVPEKDFFHMEMKYLFDMPLNNKHFFSSKYVNPSKSPFIKHCISIRYKGSSMEDIIKQMVEDDFYADNFKVCYINIENEGFGFYESRKIESGIGLNIKGTAELVNPKVLFGITKASGIWVFGECESNDYNWQSHKLKPYSYSNALNVEFSRSLVNIAAGEKSSPKLIDPCCGIGTVVIEAMDLGFNIKGCEINPSICRNAKKNLEYFGFKDVITLGDMNSIEDHYDTSIVDMPYGIFTSTTLDKQVAIIKCARKISDKMVLVTFDNMDKHIIDSGFQIIDKCSVSKGKFTRYISVCK